MTRVSAQTAFAVWLVLASAASAHAQTCFSRTGPARSQRLVGIEDTVELDADCRYGLSSDGNVVAPGALASTETDFLSLYRFLSGSLPIPSGDPRVIVARRGGRVETLMLRYCAHYLLEEQLGFRAVPNEGGGGFTLERTRPVGCSANELELRVASSAADQRLYAGAVQHTMGPTQARLTLPEGEWSVFAARPGSTTGLRIGVFRAQRVVTPLAHHLRTVGAGAPSSPLLAMRWDAGGPGMLMHPTHEALSEGLLWPELRTAADAGLLWVARQRASAGPEVIGLVQLEAQPEAVRLPDNVVRDAMAQRYGASGASLAPNEDDWASVMDGLLLCLTPSYHDPVRAPIGAAVPEGGACAALGGLATLVQAAQPTTGQICLRHGMQELRHDGVQQELVGEPSCAVLPDVGSDTRLPYQLAIAGDRVRVEGEGLCVLLDDAPIAPGEDGEIELRAGLLEVRQGGGPDCTGRQALSRLRLPVLDPQRDWHPVGLYTGGDEDAMSCGDEEGVCPWRALAHDEANRFAYVEPRHELTFALSTSGPVAAALNADAAQPVQVTQDVPLLSGIRGPLGGARPPAVVAFASRHDTCPDSTFAELRAETGFDPDDLLADATFHVFLLAVSGEDAPTRCLARAGFRVRPSRAFVAETVADFLGLELGVLGDTQAVVFFNEPVAAGLALPLVWFRMSPGIRFLTLEVTGALTMGAAFDPAEISRLGVALTWALSIGVPEYLPRILSVGGMLHGAAETSSIENPVVSFFVGLNLSTLVDLAGGR
ncbi:MAG: hypothetical protein AB8I08_18160 [Sandaracinaceae bacterium]